MATSNERHEQLSDIVKQFTTKPLARRDLLVKGMLAGAGVMGLSLLMGLPAAAATSGSQDPLSTTSKLQLVALGYFSHAYHTIRYANGGWQGALGDINSQESNGNELNFNDTAVAGINGDLHVVTTDLNSLYHTIRYANGGWAPSFGNVNNQESNGNGLSFSAIGASGTDSGKLHVVGVRYNPTDQSLYHTIRYPNGGWQGSFGDVNTQESNSNLSFSDVDCATIGEDLHVVAVGNGGALYHTIRYANGTWQPDFRSINGQESNGSLRFSRVSCASIGGNLHVVAIAGGILYHTIRYASGGWQGAFGSVNSQESNGAQINFRDTSCANISGDLQVVGVDTASSPVIWHTIRYSSNGTWQGAFGNVSSQESNSNVVVCSTLSVGGTA